MKLSTTQRTQIEALKTAAGQAGDNAMAAICEIALDAELSPDTIEGLTDQQYKTITAKYADAGAAFGWKRAEAVSECERVISENAE